MRRMGSDVSVAVSERLLPTSGTSFCPWLTGEDRLQVDAVAGLQGEQVFLHLEWEDRGVSPSSDAHTQHPSGKTLPSHCYSKCAPWAGADPQTVIFPQQHKHRNWKQHLQTSTAIWQSGFMAAEFKNKQVELIKKNSEVLPSQSPRWNNQGRHVLAHLETPPHVQGQWLWLRGCRSIRGWFRSVGLH